MSIYIKGMDMPTGCANCYFCMEYGECAPSGYRHTGDMRWRVDNRPDWCPLVPVPDHGRLIDADEFRNAMFIGEQCLYSWDEIDETIDNATAIIPADKEGNE